MGLYTKLAENIDEVDVIIAGGNPRLLPQLRSLSKLTLPQVARQLAS